MSESAGRDDIAQAQLITTMRIYDVLLAIYTHLNPTAATDLLEIHTQGGLMSAEPIFLGEFITNVLNPDILEKLAQEVEDN